MGKDYYKLLGVDKGAGEAELKKGEHASMSAAAWQLCMHAYSTSSYGVCLCSLLATLLTHTCVSIVVPSSPIPCCQHSLQKAGNAVASGACLVSWQQGPRDR